MTAKINARVKFGPEVRVGFTAPSEATDADAQEWELGKATTEEDNTPSTILATVLDAPVELPKNLKEIGRDRARTMVDRPRPGGGTLIGVIHFPEDTPRKPVRAPTKKGEKIEVGDDDTNIPDNWKDYL